MRCSLEGRRDLRVLPARWLKIADTDDGIRPGTTTTESAELRKRNKLLEQENEILRRAAAYFAKEISPK